MNWSKIKTIMICLLIVMNLFIATYIATVTFKNSSVPDSVIASTVEVLKKDGFQCDKSLIPEKSFILPTLNTSFYSASDLSEMLFGKQVPFRTEDNSLVATVNYSTLTVTENFFTFETSAEADTSHSMRKIKKALKKAGIDMKDSVYDEKERCFYRMYKGMNLFNMYIKAELDKDGNLCRISAQWPGKMTENEKKNLSFVSSVTKLESFFPAGGTINVIEGGYSLHHIGNENFLFVPAWRVRVNDELKIIE